METTKPTTVDAYIAGFPKNIQAILERIRAVVRAAAPEAEEKISYAIPTFTYSGDYLLYFAAFKNHIGLYGLPTTNEAFEKEFSLYKTGKGSVQFPLDRPIPYDLITEVVTARMKKIAQKHTSS